MTARPGDAPLYRRERIGLVLFAVLILGFGVLTEIRSCFLQFTHTDFGMLARAAWAVRTGGDIYLVTEDGGLHYTYPATFSAFMVPFADPPRGYDRAGYLPYPVSVALWYLISVALISSVLLQSRGAGLGATFGGDSSVYRSRRGIEKRLFQFTVVLATGQITVPGIGTFPPGAIPDTRITFVVERGRANVPYKTPEVPHGTVVEGAGVTILDPEGRRLATIAGGR